MVLDKEDTAESREGAPNASPVSKEAGPPGGSLRGRDGGGAR